MAVETQSPVVLRFGAFELDLRAGELHKQGLRVKLQEQPFRVLNVLLHHPGEVVTREELRASIWPADTFVDFDNSLNTSINKLREALGDSADSPRFIETLPRRGYRFIAPITGEDRKEAAIAAPGWKIAGLVAAVVVAATVAGGLFWRARQARRLTEKDKMIVLADFANTSGDPVFDDTMKQGLRVQLEQSPFLNILSDQKVNEELRLMGRPKEERLTQGVAREACQRAGGKAFLMGSISSVGTHYVVGLNALNCETGDTLGSEQVEADSREHVLKALDQSATKIRGKLGESLATIQKYNAPVEATTPSLEALKAYSLGMKTWHAKGEVTALPFFQRAVELDPKFAMAYARLGTIYDDLGDGALSGENLNKAYELREKVSERERLYIESHYYDRVKGELEKAAQVYQVWQQIYPRDVETYQNLVGFYGLFGMYEKALEEAREALRLQPDNEENYVSVSDTYIALNRLDDAATVLKEAEERKLESADLLVNRYRLAFLKGDGGEMERLVSTAAGKQTEDIQMEDVILGLAGLTEAYHGRLRKAREAWQRAVESAERNHEMGRAVHYQAGMGQVEARFGNARQARRDINAALKLAGELGPDSIEALALAGEIARAEKLANTLNQSSDKGVQVYWLPTIRATVELAHNNVDKAIELFSATSPHELSELGTFEPIYLRGQAYLMQGKGSAAAAEFQKIIDHPGLVGNLPKGALAHVGLARAYALQGDTAKSRAAYQDFLALWKDADPDLPVLKEAQAEYAKLSAVRKE